MTDFSWNEKEDQAITAILQLFYYEPVSVELFNKTHALAKNSGSDEPNELLESALAQISFEQGERRRYLSNLLGLSSKTREEQEIFLRNSAPSATNDNASLTQLSDEAKKQLSIYCDLAVKLETFYSTRIGNEHVEPLLHVLFPLEENILAGLAASIDQFVKSVAQLGEKYFETALAVPKSVSENLESVGLKYALDKYEYFGEKLAFINLVATIIKAVQANRAAQPPLDSHELAKTVGLWLYLSKAHLPEE